MDVHVEDAWALEKEVIMDSRDFESVIEESGHDRIDLVFQEDQVAHHHVHAAVTLGHCKPAPEAERRWSGDAVDGDLQIVARDVDLQDAILEITLFAEG